MAHKPFISYKYSDAVDVRDRIINSLGSDAQYYRGEDGYSNDLSGSAGETIKKYLKDMIYDTSVTIVVLSPEMNRSKWILWEIEYSLRAVSRSGKTSKTNGIVAVIKKVYSGYYWIQNKYNSELIDKSKLPKIISANMDASLYKSFGDINKESYIASVMEDEFLERPRFYIDRAYQKSQSLNNYNIVKQI